MELTMPEKRQFLELVRDAVLAGVLSKEDTAAIIGILNQALLRKTGEGK